MSTPMLPIFPDSAPTFTSTTRSSSQRESYLNPSSSINGDLSHKSRPDNLPPPPIIPTQKPVFLNFSGLKRAISRAKLKATATYISKGRSKNSGERELDTQSLSLAPKRKRKLSVMRRFSDGRDGEDSETRLGTCTDSASGTVPPNLKLRRKHSLSSFSLLGSSTTTKARLSRFRTRSVFGLHSSQNHSMASNCGVVTTTRSVNPSSATTESFVVSPSPSATALFDSFEAEARWTRLLEALELAAPASNVELEEDCKRQIRRSRSFSGFQSGCPWDHEMSGFLWHYELDSEFDESGDSDGDDLVGIEV